MEGGSFSWLSGGLLAGSLVAYRCGRTTLVGPEIRNKEKPGATAMPIKKCREVGQLICFQREDNRDERLHPESVATLSQRGGFQPVAPRDFRIVIRALGALRADDQHEKTGQSSSVAAVAASVAAEDHGPAAHAGEHRDCAGERGGDGADQEGAVVDVAGFVGEDAFLLFFSQQT